MIQVRHEEQYTLLLPITLLDDTEYEELEKRVIESMEAGRRNFILHLEQVPGTAAGLEHQLSRLQQIIQKEEGMLVVSAPPEQMENNLLAQEIVTTPTLDEATDYIFMEEIERQLRSEADDEELAD